MNIKMILKNRSGRPAGIIGLALPALVLIAVAGCVKLTRDTIPRQLYALNAEGEPAADRVILPGTVLKVRSFQEMPRYHGREFIYRLSDVRYQNDYYNMFLASPGALLAEETGQWLAICGCFEKVVSASSSVRASHLLEGTVILMEGDFRDKNAPKAVLGLSFTLICHRNDEPSIVFQKYYAHSTPLRDTAPATLVEGWNTALQKILTAFVIDLAAAGKSFAGSDAGTIQPPVTNAALDNAARP